MESSIADIALMKRYTAGEVIDKYKIVSVLGEGGIGIVYRAEHMLLGTDVALKMCKLQNSSAQERLRIEGRAQTKLKHPNIVSVHDMIEIEDSPCLVMEYVSGFGLDEWLDANTPTTQQSQTLFLQILDAMECAHSQNIIHRDLKPSNIMITQINGRPFAKVCDFVLAKNQHQMGPNLTRTGAMMGTPAYMAPEQIRNAKETDHRADIFSLGAIYYELLTGTMAFTGSDTLELLNSVANEPHRPPSELIPNLEERHNHAIQGSLIKNPFHRIPDCSTFRGVLLGEQIWTDAKELVAQHETLLGDGESTLEFVRPRPKTLPTDDEKTERMTRRQQQATVAQQHPTRIKPATAPKQDPLPKVESPAISTGSTISLPTKLYQIIMSQTRSLTGILTLVIIVLYGFPKDAVSPSTKQATPAQDIVQSSTIKEPLPQKMLSKEQKTEIGAITVEPSPETKTRTKQKEKKKRVQKSVQADISAKETESKKKTETKTTTVKEKKQETATISFSGADGLVLKGKKGTFSSGKVPVGTYKVYGIFKDREIPVGDITLKANQKKHFACTKTLRCN